MKIYRITFMDANHGDYDEIIIIAKEGKAIEVLLNSIENIENGNREEIIKQIEKGYWIEEVDFKKQGIVGCPSRLN